MLNFAADVCRDLPSSARREWLETNGLGGFASSTLSGMNTRRYHGLLVAATRPPTERLVMLSRLEETLTVGDASYELSTNRYSPEVIHPQGYLRQTGFRLDPFPVFTFRAGEVEIEKSIFMLHGENTTVVRYRLTSQTESARDVTLSLRPLVAFRHYHHLGHERPGAFAPLEIEPGIMRLVRGTKPSNGKPSQAEEPGAHAEGDEAALYLAHDARRILVEEVWYRNFVYREEQARGFDFQEDLFNPCTLLFDLRQDRQAQLVASTARHTAEEAPAFEQRERERRIHLVQSTDAPASERARETSEEENPPETSSEETAAEANDDTIAAANDATRRLRLAADQFIVRRGAGLHTVIAGYHWFTDWGRDTMISLVGLTLSTGRFEIAREILLAFVEHLRDGLIPNLFVDEGGHPEYNTADATLWFVHAAGELLRRTDDEQFIRQRLYEPLQEIIRRHEQGTRYGIRVDPEDHLLRVGEEGVQLTWMDAKVGDEVVTPRTGKPVEIQALWYNALRHVEEMAARFRDTRTRDRCRATADGLRASFNGLFWNSDERCLFDYLADDGTADTSIRPNQIFAVSLPHSLVTGKRARQIVETVRRELLTPYGLRTLAPSDKAYRGRYEGDARARDGAYHQGTVWTWLMGAFITAYLKVNERSAESLVAAREWLEPFREHLGEAGVGQISEIFDGDSPHTPRGCIAQAWSVAEILRCELEELG